MRNYQKELDAILETLPRGEKPTLLLHACCGPCSSYVIEYLCERFDITIFYYNPNIHPKEEYFRRLGELKKFLTEFPPSVRNNVKLIVDEYNPEDYFEATNVRNEPDLQTEREKGERCRRCYEFRMKKAFRYASENDFDWFTTTLSISPHKDSQKINAIGFDLEKSQEAKNSDSAVFQNLSKLTKFLPADFKKKGGFLRSTELSAEYGLWRQDYCGCVFSMSPEMVKASR